MKISDFYITRVTGVANIFAESYIHKTLPVVINVSLDEKQKYRYTWYVVTSPTLMSVATGLTIENKSITEVSNEEISLYILQNVML